MSRRDLGNRSSEQLTNDINMTFAKNYISPFLLKDVTEDSMRDNKPILYYIDWGLRARGVIDTDTQESNNALMEAYELGIADGRIDAKECQRNNRLNIFLVKKNTLLFLCEYGDEIIYSRLVLESGKNINRRTIWITEACCPDLMHAEIRIFSNIYLTGDKRPIKE